MVSYAQIEAALNKSVNVLILIVVDDGLVQKLKSMKDFKMPVLILIVVDDGLVLTATSVTQQCLLGLNPYCSGRWSRTPLQFSSRVL